MGFYFIILNTEIIITPWLALSPCRRCTTGESVACTDTTATTWRSTSSTSVGTTPAACCLASTPSASTCSTSGSTTAGGRGRLAPRSSLRHLKEVEDCGLPSCKIKFNSPKSAVVLCSSRSSHFSYSQQRKSGLANAGMESSSHPQRTHHWLHPQISAGWDCLSFRRISATFLGAVCTSVCPCLYVVWLTVGIIFKIEKQITWHKLTNPLLSPSAPQLHIHPFPPFCPWRSTCFTPPPSHLPPPLPPHA